MCSRLHRRPAPSRWCTATRSISTVEYRNDLSGGLENGFYLSELGVFARDKSGSEVMIYYGSLGDYPQWVQPYTQGAVEVRRFPLAIGLSNTANVRARVQRRRLYDRRGRGGLL